MSTSATTKLRGDGDLFSLMDEMLSSQQGYHNNDDEPPAASTTSTEVARSDDDDDHRHVRRPQQEERRVRLVAEVNDYPSTNNKKFVGGGIWNPYVQVVVPPTKQKHCCSSSTTTAARCSTMSFFPPTNPHVEVFRRRAYERFKNQFRDAIERISVHATTSTTTTATKKVLGPNNLWNKLSVPAMLERWQFDTKLEELLNTTDQERYMELSPLYNDRACVSTTNQIHVLMEEQGVVDPILLSTNVEQKNARRGDGIPQNSDSSSLRSSSTLLSDEIKFEWTRTWKRIVGDRARESDLSPIFKSKRFQKKVSTLSRVLTEAAADAEESFRVQVSKRSATEAAQQSGRRRPFQTPSTPKVVVQEDGGVDVRFSGLSFRINSGHYLKLQMMFDRMHPNATDRTLHESAFASSLFCLLARYDMLQGAGLQASVHGSVFDVLLKHFDCRFECFASPLNSRYEKFCSAFLDTDGPFGSLGSFFDYDFTEGGCYQANPPFTTTFLTAMNDKMERALQTCDAPLMFVVFVPTWKEVTGWNMLVKSVFRTKHISIPQSSHYYAEGTQHRRRERYRVASFDTSVFFLQNEAARKKWTVADVMIDDLKSAFRLDSKHDVDKAASLSAEKLISDVSTAAEGPKKVVKCMNQQPIRDRLPNNKVKKKKRKANGMSFSQGANEGARHLDLLH